jgi:6-phosphofructokinase 1
MKRIAVLTSGGDAPGMNAAIRAVVRIGTRFGYEVFGVRHGFAGLISGQFHLLGPREVGGIIHEGGTMLGTSRCDAMLSAAGRAAAVGQLHKHDISGLVVIGGNGSQTGALALTCSGLPVIGIASTIDNDLFGTDISIGATTAMDVALEAIDRLRVTAASHDRAFLVEVMGRHTGHLAAAVAIGGGAEAVVVPEMPTEARAIEAQIQMCRSRGKSHAIIVVAEGATLNADALLHYFKEHAPRLGYELRATRLGHVQRGGAPGIFDRMLGSELGAAAIEALSAGKRDVLVGWRNGAASTTSLSEVADRTKPLDPRLFELAGELAM